MRSLRMNTAQSLIIAAGLVGAVYAGASSRGQQSSLAQVRTVEVQHFSDHADLVLKTDRAPVFQSRSKANPNILVVDVVNAESQVRALPKALGDAVTKLSIDNRTNHGQKIARLTIDLEKDVQYRVGAEAREVRVSIYPDTEKNIRLKADSFDGMPLTRLAQSSDSGASFDDDGTGGSKMTFVGFRDTSDESRVFARLSEAAEFNVRKEGSSVVVLEIQGASIPLRNNKNHLDATYFDSPVKMITPSEVAGDPDYIRITIEMKEDVSFESRREGREVAVYFKK